ncbi:hypothetical protein DQ04_06681070, partial [Trypanosoma grayi]|uniref:hypothetical protein n=1 Tax=Trypanosoma grayi TaxID=71804 RepID=UPI0004F46688
MAKTFLTRTPTQKKANPFLAPTCCTVSPQEINPPPTPQPRQRAPPGATEPGGPANVFFMTSTLSAEVFKFAAVLVTACARLVLFRKWKQIAVQLCSKIQEFHAHEGAEPNSKSYPAPFPLRTR